ncbi:MAG: macro domain-containing protein, partial [Lachnospiraceae bacterium]|nr:macro domain-containing protein [Lachnospiraceae bacterium]
GYQLPAKYVIHTVGPVWNGGKQNEPELLASCYRSCLRIAKEKRLNSIAFPAISTGIYGYPKDQAAEVAVRTIIEETKDADEDFEVILVAFDAENEQLYNQVIQRVAIG